MRVIFLPSLFFGSLRSAALLLALIVPVLADGAPRGGLPAGPAADASWISMADANWNNGFGDAVTVQANPGDVAIVPDPDDASRKVLKVRIERSENFANVVNGSPRAELLFHKPATFAQGSDYLVSWSTYIPRDFAFDSKQLVIISQIHQSRMAGGPTLALTLLGKNYFISTRGGMQVQKTTAGAKMCCADSDKGKWVRWVLRYVPDDSGKHSLTQLWKNGAPVFLSTHVANAYPDDQEAYLKMGLYKSGWEKAPSDATSITLFYGPVSVRKR